MAVCPFLPEDETRRAALVAANEADLTCWKCGEFGHRKHDCPSTQATSKPPKVHPPTVGIDTSVFRQTKSPFDAWVEALYSTIEAPRHAKVRQDVPLTGNDREDDERNWNRHRKCSWLIVVR